MIEIFGNFWDELGDLHVITTNGTVKRNGGAVMGRGIAAQAKRKLPYIDATLGQAIRDKGNNVHCLGMWGRYEIASFPVKWNWWEDADLELIERSAHQLVALSEEYHKIVMVRPGCGNGNLEWDVVKPVLNPILDDSFYIINNN